MTTQRPWLRVLCAVLAALCAAASLSSCKRVLHPRRHVRPVSPQARRGRALYLRYCALCHARDGRGYAADHANALANPEFLRIASDGFLQSAITHGRPGTPMAAWGKVNGGPLEDREVVDLVAYLRTFARRPKLNLDDRAAQGDTNRGRSLWDKHCVTCHGDHGQGSERATSVSHPNFLHTASDGFLRASITRGRPGTLMAGFPTLSPEAVDDLVAYLRAQETAPSPPPPPVYEPPPDLSRLVLNPTARPPQFTLREGRFVPGEQVYQAMQQHRRMVILDARATSDWSRAHIAGAMPFPFYDINDMVHQLPNDGTWIVAYCACPHAASGHVVDLLREKGYRNTAVLDEGVTWWTNQHYPMAQAAILH